jgi:tRNA U34 5-methylaminomethyl-2-thiouridine-forming methyltransferase MnmC
MEYEKKLIITADGSHSIELIGQNEQYHSVHGAIQESQHVFIDYGLKQIAERKKDISILEIGMGTGLNLLLTYLFSQNKDIRINYLALEPYPVKDEIWKELNYAYQLEQLELQEVFQMIHSSIWSKKLNLSEEFSFIKEQESILEFQFENQFDMVYFDAFNPDLEPDLWSEDVFRNIFNSMNKGGLLSTYSTKGVVKRALKSCGFEIIKQPGPIGKREILNAWKK